MADITLEREQVRLAPGATGAFLNVTVVTTAGQPQPDYIEVTRGDGLRVRYRPESWKRGNG